MAAEAELKLVSPKIEKILYLCADKGIPYWGTKGGSIHIREFVKAFQATSRGISVIARLGKKDSQHDSNAPLHRLPSPTELKLLDQALDVKSNSSLQAEIRSFYLNPYIERMAKKIKSSYDFQLVYERYSLFGVAGLKYARKNRIPFVLEVNSPLVIESSRYRSLALEGLAKAIEKYLFEGADHIIAVSEEIKRYILKISSTASVTVVPNGVDTDLYNAKYDDIKLPTGLKGIEDSDLVIGFVGRLRPWHGVEILVDSFADLTKIEQNCKLLIIGDDGGLKNELLDRCRSHGINDHVIFTGAVSHGEIPSILKKCDIMAAPYPEIDNFYFSALKIFEYMAAGKAIVASRIGQIPHILTHNKTALLVPPGNREALTEALITLKQDDDSQRKLGENARLEAFSKHSWRQRIEVITDIFDNLRRTRID